MSKSTEDKRLRLLEVLLTVGGFLGIIINLQPEGFDQLREGFSTLLVLFIISSFGTYALILHKGEKSRIKVLTFLLSASFSGLLILTIAEPLIKGFAVIVSIVPDTRLAVTIVLMAVALYLFHRLYTTMSNILLKE